jgi:hypothetical protein
VGARPAPAPLRARRCEPADEGRLYREIARILAEAVERRGSSIDDYTAPDGDGSMQEHLRVYQRDRRGRARAAGHRCGGSSSARARPTSARGASGCLPATSRAPRHILRGMEPRRSGRATDRRTGAALDEIGGRGRRLGTPTGSTRRAAGTTAARTERTEARAAHAAAAPRAAVAHASRPAPGA